MSEKLYTYLKNRLDEDSGGSAWLYGLRLNLAGETLHVAFLHPYFFDWFIIRHARVFEQLARQYVGDLKFVYHREGLPAQPAQGPAKSARLSVKKNVCQPQNCLDDFFYNEKNLPVIEALKAFAAPFHTVGRLRPALLYGESGSGKTHLLKSILAAHAARESSANLRLFSARKSRRPELLQFLRGIFQGLSRQLPLVLLIDDLEADQESLELEDYLADLLDLTLEREVRENSSSENGFFKDLRLVCAMCANNTPGHFGARLQSRLEATLALQLQPPDLEIRLRYAENLNKKLRLGLGKGALLFLARQNYHLASIAGLLNRLALHARNGGQSPAISVEMLAAGTGAANAPADWRSILQETGKSLDLKTDAILGKSRKPDLVLARQIAMYLGRLKLGLSFQELGKLLGGLDHSTVMHGVKKVQQLRLADKDLHNLLTQLENRIK